MNQDINSLNESLFGSRLERKAELKLDLEQWNEALATPNPLGVAAADIAEDIRYDWARLKRFFSNRVSKETTPASDVSASTAAVPAS